MTNNLVKPVVAKFERATAGLPAKTYPLWQILGVITVIGIWTVVANTQPDYLFPGPVSTLKAAAKLWQNGGLGWAILLTLYRCSLGLLLSCTIGLVWGWANGRIRQLRAFSSTWLQTLMSVPPIVIVVLGLVWFGPNSVVVIFVVALVTIPLLVTATSEAIVRIDTELVEMARIFKLSSWKVFKHVTLRSVAPPILAALTVAIGQSIRLTVMAELLCTSTGVGAAIQMARVNIETPDVFALSLIMALLSLSLELCVLSPLRRRILPPERNYV